MPTLYFLSIVVRKVQLLHRKQGYNGKLRLNGCVVDARGTVPFIGTTSYFDEVDATNFPYVIREIGFFHALDDTSSWPTLAPGRDEIPPESTLNVDITTALAFFIEVAQSLGIAPYALFGLRNNDLDAVDWHPLVAMFSDVHSTNFSFSTHQNAKARR